MAAYLKNVLMATMNPSESNSKEAKVIYFACTNNTCRSPMAEAIANKMISEKGLSLEAHSFGIMASVWGNPGSAASEHGQLVCEEIGIDLSEHASQGLDEILEDLPNATAIFCMSEWHYRTLSKGNPGLRSITFMLDPYRSIPDPIGADIETYRRTRDVIIEKVESRLEELIENNLTKGSKSKRAKKPKKKKFVKKPVSIPSSIAEMFKSRQSKPM